MRIAIIAPLVTPIAEPQRGGSQAVVADLARGLSREGVVVTVFASEGSEIEGVEIESVEVPPELARAALFRLDGSNDPQAMAPVFRSVASSIDGSFDLVHSHAFDPPALDALSGLGVPTVHTLHLPPTQPMIAAARSISDPEISFINVSVRQAQLWDPYLPSIVIPNGVPIDRIPVRKEKEDRLLFVGRITPEKGALDAIEIAMLADMPLRIIGQPYDLDHQREIQERAKRGHVELLGEMTRPGVWEEMASARALLMPIHWEEPFGLTAVEAQAAGTPVVGYRRGSLAEVVRDGVTGALVDEGDLRAAATHAQGGTFSALDCRWFAASHFGLERMVRSHIQVYDRLLSKVLR